MRRIKTANTVSTIPADASTGTVGWFTNGDQFAGIEPTHLTAEFCNSVQGELYSFLQEEGMTESQTDMTQVMTAAKQMRSRNCLLNGHMSFTKDVSSYTAMAATQYVLPKWKYFTNVATATHSFSQDTTTYAPSSPYNEIINTNASFTVNAVSTAAAGEYQTFTQHVLNENFAAIGFNPCVLSFWVRSSKTGTFAVALTDQGTGTLPSNTPTQSFVATYTVNAANTWEYKTISIPAIPSTWDFTKTIGVSVHFVLDCGTTRKTSTLNQWVSGHYLSASTGITSLTDSTSNSIKFANVQLERGTFASRFIRMHSGYEQSLLNRYFQFYNLSQATSNSVNVTTGTSYSVFYRFNMSMRVTPTITLTGNAGNTGAFPATVGTVSEVGVLGFCESRTTTATANAQRFGSKWTADAELYGA